MLRWAEIDLKAIQSNLNAIKNKIGNRKIIAVVKANAYGHGAIPVARAIAEQADMFAVATVEEAIELREASITLPILNLYCILPDQAEAVLKYKITQTVCKLSTCEAISACAKRKGDVAQVHVKVDTGMNRIGVHYSEAAAFLKQVHALPNLRVEGIFTHFSSADEVDKSYTHLQLERFNDLWRPGSSEQGTGNNHLEHSDFLIHAANSAAILDLPSTYFDAVRPGLILHGVYPSDEVSRSISLKPALSLKTRVVHLKSVERGESISYNRRYTTTTPTQIATLSMGYADGYRTSLANVGEALIRGIRAPVVGTVCMDKIMCDVGHIPDVEIGDEVVLIGKQGDDEITADEVAKKAGTISYEIFCGLGRRVERIYRK
ncbi:TPA: alanine racemase [Candidatus Poribacteria bacterium]|nr:alanine racemase [Candidatus Poribacteria bacterium]